MNFIKLTLSTIGAVSVLFLAAPAFAQFGDPEAGDTTATPPPPPADTAKPAVAPIAFKKAAGARPEAEPIVEVEVVSTPRMTSRNRQTPTRVADMLRFYAAVTALIHETEDAKEGPRAFSEKRVPQFKNR